MIEVLHHRGPDDGGQKVIKTPHARIGLGHRRLSILDLSDHGHQPMCYEHLSITYNGEVYNFKDIRSELEKSGYRFESDTDTEVVLKSFHKWGESCLSKFRGMWAFAIYNHKQRELFLCRDRIGVKPLYYSTDPQGLLFASELKSFYSIQSFNKKEDIQSLYYYFKYGYIPTPRTIFENTYKLEPGSWLTIDEHYNIKKGVYWNPHDYSYTGNSDAPPIQENQLVEQLENILQEAFNLRMVADVPVGMFLSGGIDSSLVTALLQSQRSQKINTFTIGFNEKIYNEARWAKKVAEHLGSHHTELYIQPQDVWDNIAKLPEIFDEPFADSSALPTLMVSQLARKNVTVSLSADGGDELFGGYNNYQPVKKFYTLMRYIPTPLRWSLNRLLQNPFVHYLGTRSKFIPYKVNRGDKYAKLKASLFSKSVLDIFDQSKSIWIEENLEKLFSFNPESTTLYKTDLKYQDFMNLVFLFDQKTYLLDDILTKVDRTTMAVSLEGREPFLDNKVVEFALGLPSRWKIYNGQNKYLLKKILYKHLPEAIVDRPKQGFGMPVNEWFRKDLKKLYEHYLSEESLKRTGYFHVDYIRKKLSSYYQGNDINANKFWLILMYMMWREKWL